VAVRPGEYARLWLLRRLRRPRQLLGTLSLAGGCRGR
jgi:hypothetical protein